MSDTRLLFELKELSVTREGDDRPELDRFSLALGAGETVVLLGETGCGKEAVLRVLGGFTERYEDISGTIRFSDGEEIKASRRPRAPLRIAYLPDAAAHPLDPHASALSQLSRIVARKLGSPRTSAYEELRASIARLTGAPPIENFAKPVSALDDVAINWGLLAAAMAQTPELVLADHAFADLSPTSTLALTSALLAEKERLGFAMLLAARAPQIAVRLASQVMVLRHGRIVEVGSAARLAGGHAHAYTQTLFKALPRLALDKPAARAALRGESLLQVHGLDLRPHDTSKARSRETLTFELRRGASLALIGEQGSGRHALARAVIGLARLPGRVVFDAVDLNVLSQAMTARLRRRIAFITGTDDSLDPRMTLWDTIDEPLRAHLGLSRELIAGYRDSALKRVGLASHDGGRPAGTLSPFDKRRLQVARAIVAAPLLAVVDEPLRGLDAFAQTILRDLLNDFRANQAPSFLVITADFSVAQALADDALVFKDRHIVERGAIRDLLRAPKDAHTRGLIDAVAAPALSPEPATV
jgi:peptide/nickel transport system ATP-binding protein